MKTIITPIQYLIPLFILLFALDAQAQIPMGFDNRRTKDISYTQDTFRLDTFSILPHTIVLREKSTQQLLDTSYFLLLDNRFLWKKKPDTLCQISYRVLPFHLGRAAFHKDTAFWAIKTTESMYAGNPSEVYVYNPMNKNSAANNNIFNAKGLDYNGALARGISVGNNQDLVLNSSFNVQMQGKIGEDIEITGAISDNSVPLQPDGNTQQLQELDKIFLQIKRKKVSLVIGDQEVTKPDGYFLQYFRRVQGLSLANEWGKASKFQLNSFASASLSRGKFARNIVQGIEGNQGPYRLMGANGERFIIVLAGTERIYADGRLLTRGIENDYVVDYNRGEIVFTPKLLITKDIRLTMEFSYSEQNFIRFTETANAAFKKGKATTYFNFYNEHDSKNQSSQQTLTDEQREVLRNIGDSVQLAFVPGVDTVEFDAKRILYAQIDTLHNAALYRIFQYSTNAEAAKFALTFTEVGANKGNYSPATTAANGRVYKWVAPDANGIPQGSFEPVVRLAAPKSLQLLTVGAKYEWDKTAFIKAEAGFSNKDNNTFSAIDNQDNRGAALRLQAQKEWKWDKIALRSFANYELVQSRFEVIDPYRAVEFARDWNVNTAQRKQENWLAAGVGVTTKSAAILYEAGVYDKRDLYAGLRHNLTANYAQKGWKIQGNANFLQSKTPIEATRFWRPNIEIQKLVFKKGGWQIGARYEEETNRRQNTVADTLDKTSFSYQLYKLWFGNADTARLNWNTSFSQRNDAFAFAKDFKTATVAQDISTTANWQEGTVSQLQLKLTYRNLMIKDKYLTTQLPQATYLARIQHTLRLWKSVFTLQTTYDLGSGQEQKLEYNYLEVPAGQGVYTWIDRNGDGVRQVNEFEVAAFPDQAIYVRVNAYTNEYIQTNTAQIAQQLSINPAALRVTKPSKTKALLDRFSTLSSVEIIRKTREGDDVQLWNPYQLKIADTTLVSMSSRVRNALFFNRSNPDFGIEFTTTDSRQKVILTTGFEARSRTENILKVRKNFGKTISLQTLFTILLQENDAEFFNERDYKLPSYQPELTANWLLRKNLRTIVGYKYRTGSNKIGDEQVTWNDFSNEWTFNQATQTSLRAKLSFVRVNYVGAKNTATEYALLEGLQNGNNFLWNITIDKRLTKNLQLNIGYEGRRTGQAERIIHTGRMQIRAVF